MIERKDAPYAPPSNVIELIHRFRDRNLPEFIDVDLLKDVGIASGNVHRTLAALRFLGLVDDDGSPSPSFHSIQMATETEYREILESVVRSSYQDIFKVGLDPSKDSQMVIDNHFRRYQPASQRGRMVTLFLALCREAGLPILDVPRKRSTKRSVAGVRQRVVTRLGQPISTRRASAETQMPEQLDVSSLQTQYVAALIESVKQAASRGEQPSPDLLDRIETWLRSEKMKGEAEHSTAGSEVQQG